LISVPAIHTFLLTTGSYTVEYAKSVEGGILTGYELGSGVTFIVTITVSGDIATDQPVTIEDSLDSELLVWDGSTVAEVVEATNCEVVPG